MSATDEVLAGERRWWVEASDAVSWLRSLPAGVAQVCVTSPPYWGLRAYLKAGDPLKHLELGQEKSPAEYVAGQVAVFREVRRVLRDDAVLWCNLGDSYWGGGGGNYNGESKSVKGRQGVHLTNVKNREAPSGLKPLDQCCIPHWLYMALIEDGWFGRADCCWSKLNAMPISVRGWRFERCRVKTKGQPVPRNTVERAGQVLGGPVTEKGLAEWADCPGCKKCSKTGGLVLRKGSWRPTSSHEYIFLLVKSSEYFMDGDAVRTPLASATLSRDQYTRLLDDPDEQHAVKHDHETPSNPGGANLRDVFRHDATAADVFAWLAETDPALGEALWQRWVEGQGMHSVLRVGPEPLKARHYAAFPTALVTPLLRSSTSERGQCSACGSPWVRIVEQGERNGKMDYDGKMHDTEPQNAQRRMLAGVRAAREAGGDHANPFTPNRTVGWRATCTCDAPTRPQLVIDPYAGSGRTGMAARRLGLRFLGCDLNPEFAALANAAIQADAIDVPLVVGSGPSLFDALPDAEDPAP